ncbi:hypothetical protein CAPTEDRAFT_229273 [Capitella teleta]|uniref:Transmembrane protein n=1 Tax=Capitella teleta TaxID=283909 RepID=R7UK35_CAPTE|nr:hypothetical protein CAPTEDRAFT_229273 [Capitella teleta]|eukprot:ELU06909.1 hypothetical protein CAPTEDRAFT_229273 [Capitella teleta]
MRAQSELTESLKTGEDSLASSFIADEVIADVSERPLRRWSTTLRGVISVACHTAILTSISVVIWIVYDDVIFQRKTLLITAISVSAFAYVIMLTEMITSQLFGFLASFHGNQTATEYIARVQSASPQVEWRATCYHYELPPLAALRSDRQPTTVTHSRLKSKVVTLKDSEVLEYSAWKDSTRNVSDLLHKPLIQIECSRVFIFQDEESKQRYLEQYVIFRERNRLRDEFMEHQEDFTIPGYEEKLLVRHGHSRSAEQEADGCDWSRLGRLLSRLLVSVVVSKWTLLLLAILLLSWPYRLIVNRLMGRVYVTFIKVITV